MPEKTFTSNQRKATLIGGGAFHLYHDGIADGMAAFLPLWHLDFGLSLGSVGLLVTCFEGAAGIFQIPAGFLGERFGERTSLAAGTLMTAAAFACMWMAAGLSSLVILLIIGGIGAAVQHPLASSMISRVFNDKGRRLALGTYNFSGDIGKFLFPALAAVALSKMSWRPLCTILGIFGYLLTSVLYFILKRTLSGEKIIHTKEKQKFSASGKWGIENRSAFAILSTIGIIDTAVRIGIVSFVPFIFIQKGIRPESVGFALSLLLIGGAAGKFICGAAAERIGIIFTIVITEIVTGLGAILLTILPLSFMYLFLPILGAALNGTSSVLYGTVADFVSSNRVARVFGLFYTFIIISAAITPPVVGSVSDILGIGNSIRLVGCVALMAIPLAAVLRRQMHKKSHAA